MSPLASNVVSALPWALPLLFAVVRISRAMRGYVLVYWSNRVLTDDGTNCRNDHQLATACASDDQTRCCMSPILPSSRRVSGLTRRMAEVLRVRTMRRRWDPFVGDDAGVGVDRLDGMKTTTKRMHGQEESHGNADARTRLARALGSPSPHLH